MKCLLLQRSGVHRVIQESIRWRLRRGTVHLEHRFPSIGRIADIFWPQLRAVFEIQCSPISLAELTARTTAYESIGMAVGWIFHVREFYGSARSFVEGYLGDRYYLFTDMTIRGSGDIYHLRADGRWYPVDFSIPYRSGRSLAFASEVGADSKPDIARFSYMRLLEKLLKEVSAR